MTNPQTPLEHVESRLGDLARAGFTVSVCCGPSRGRDVFTWSVQVLSPNGEEFDQPYEALGLAHCVEIAEAEIAERWWR